VSHEVIEGLGCQNKMREGLVSLHKALESPKDVAEWEWRGPVSGVECGVGGGDPSDQPCSDGRVMF
jgi:hypothetical protein